MPSGMGDPVRHAFLRAARLDEVGTAISAAGRPRASQSAAHRWLRRRAGPGQPELPRQRCDNPTDRGPGLAGKLGTASPVPDLFPFRQRHLASLGCQPSSGQRITKQLGSRYALISKRAQAINLSGKPEGLCLLEILYYLERSEANLAIPARQCEGRSDECNRIPSPQGGKRVAMRRYLVLSVLGTCLLVFASGATALAGASTSTSTSTSTYYAGTNSQGQQLLFTVDHTASGPMFDPIFINQISRCPASGDVLSVGFSFQGLQIPITNGQFSLVLNDLGDRFSWTGTVTSKRASGKESINLAAFDNQGGLQDCGAGSLSWTARALVPASSANVTPKTAYLVKVTKAPDGSVHLSITH
jgi:hypothetical protein